MSKYAEKKILMVLTNGTASGGYREILDELGDAFVELGHAVSKVAGWPDHQLIASINDSKFELKFIFGINIGRPSSLDREICLMSWFCDFIHPESQLKLESLEPSDVAYFLGSAEACGVRTSRHQTNVSVLYPGVSKKLLLETSHLNGKRTIDYMLMGHLPSCVADGMTPEPTRYDLYKKLKFHAKKMIKKAVNWENQDLMRPFIQRYVRRKHRVLSGKLQTDKLVYDCLQELKGQLDSRSRRYNLEKLEVHIGSVVNHFPRFLDRFYIGMELVHTAMERRNSIAGDGFWAKYACFDELFEGYWPREHRIRRQSSARFQICNNTHGMSVSTRVLESMALGCVVAQHETEYAPKTPGTLSHLFNVGQHYVEYNAGNLRGSIITDFGLSEKGLRDISCEARNVVASRHQWSNRAKSILQDHYSRVVS